MKPYQTLLALTCVLVTVTGAAPSEPTVGVEALLPLDNSTVVGYTAKGVDIFRGIPYADPPTGPLRLKPPRRLSRSLGVFDARNESPACPQMLPPNSDDLPPEIASIIIDSPLFKKVAGQEDCLTISVQRPAGTEAGEKLPVLFWIYGGGFALGSTRIYDASSLLANAVAQGQPFIFVSVNYRLGGFGFIPGKEVRDDGSANLGLLDQRLGLEWVADNIAAFGGDPDKVTIWGESAGSISVFDQMMLYGGNATYKGKTLFRGAIMDSGSLAPADPMDCPKGQHIYDTVVEHSGCGNAKDTLECLRSLPYDDFLLAVNSLPGELSLSLSYLPRPDGKVLRESSEIAAETGHYYAVPMITGDQEDEGTLFSLTQRDLATTSDIVDYFSANLFPRASKDILTGLVESYSPMPSEGSPFRTGLFNEIYPGFKRLAAIQGDLSFTLARRVMLNATATVRPEVPSWSYLASYNWGMPVVGTSHGSDIVQTFFGVPPNYAMASSRTYYFNFLYNLDPNKGTTGYPDWPTWKDGHQLLWFETPLSISLLKDDFRGESYDHIQANRHVLHV